MQLMTQLEGLTEDMMCEAPSFYSETCQLYLLLYHKRMREWTDVDEVKRDRDVVRTGTS